uniref:Putative myosin-g heavy chain n=1 Tax=Corethrella appendiculata TaxID=1370023 RepID=U5ENU1_9DIPT
MTDAIKLTDMQRANIEYERQRHLANWLIESSPHMPKPSTTTTATTAAISAHLTKQKINKKFKQNPIHFFSKIVNSAHNNNNSNHVNNNNNINNIINNNNSNLINNNNNSSNNNNLPPQATTIFTSQTNLPLQIISSSGRDGHKPKLRRFNSHDTSANMFSVAEFENARLARRNELEKQRQRYKMNSLSSGGDCSTGDSKGSKLSHESNVEPLVADTFLERFSLPRVVRLSYASDHLSNSNNHNSSGNQTILSTSSSNESTSNFIIVDSKKKSKSDKLFSQHNGGELFLLYRYMKDYKIYHIYNTKNGAQRKKGLKIPQDFPGYFSLLNDKGAPTATVYTAIVQLVRERVYKFLSVDNISAYTESLGSDTYQQKTHYVKTTAKAGQVYRLLAVFQDSDQKKSLTSHKNSSINSGSVNGGTSSCSNGSASGNSNEKERGKYAQLLGDNRQIYYVSLSTKGKFYEIEQHSPQLLQKCNSLNGNSISNSNQNNSKLPKQLNPECVHRIHNIVMANSSNNLQLPISLKFVSGTNSFSIGNHNHIPEYVTLAKITTETFVVACPIDESDHYSPLNLTKIHITPQMKFAKCILGFENEQRMFANQNVQNLLKFCQFNCDSFTKSIDYDSNLIVPQAVLAASEQQSADDRHHHHHYGKNEIFKKFNFSKLFSSSDKHTSGSGHEKEDSIIFLTKNDLENLESNAKDIAEQQYQSMPVNLNSEKMKVFQTASTSNRTKWFKNLRSNSSDCDNRSNRNSLEISGAVEGIIGGGTAGDKNKNKIASMERYKDMSKLIQERFGDIDLHVAELAASTANANKANSDIGYEDRDTSINESIQKCFSLQNIEMDVKNRHRPDLVNNIKFDAHGDDDRIDIIDSDDVFLPTSSAKNVSNKNTKNQSFMTEKLYNEFHVKTKQYSKSSSSLHQLLHFAVPHKPSVYDMKKRPQHSAQFREKKKSEEVLSFEDLKNMHQDPDADDNEVQYRNGLDDSDLAHDTSSLSILDDLPYSSVRDSIIVQEETDIQRPPSESIYAEICSSSCEQPSTPVSPLAPEFSNNRLAPSNIIKSKVTEGDGGSIKISISSDISTSISNKNVSNISVITTSNPPEPSTRHNSQPIISDNIYNSID